MGSEAVVSSDCRISGSGEGGLHAGGWKFPPVYGYSKSRPQASQ